MLGVVAATSSLGTLVIAPALQSILARHDWHIGMVFFLILAVAMVPAAFSAGGADLLPRQHRSNVTMREVLGQAARHRGFLVMSIAYFVCGLQLVFLTTHLPNYLVVCGLDPMLSAQALAIIGGVNVFGSWFAGWLGNRYPKHILLGLLYVLRSCTLTAYFITPPTPTSTLVFATVMGMLWLGVIPLVSGHVAAMFGTRYMATLLGIAFIMHQFGSFLGALGGGLIYDAMGSYDRAWQAGVMIGVTAGILQMVAGGPPRRRDPIGRPALVTAG
jgi:predicted MFS family arabinose efflux permease